jgi:hypothetical protein
MHREYFKEKVVIFCESLPIGNSQLKIELLPRLEGTFAINPVRVEQMYFPLNNANNELKRVVVKSE